MDALTKKLMQEAGFESGSVGELLGLSEAQETLVEIKVRLTQLLREERRARGWSQNRLAQAMGKKQQVVARTEMAHRSVTLDLLLRALLTIGVKMSRIARELEACEQYVEGAQNSVGALVEIGPILNLVPRERVSSQTTIFDAPRLLYVMRDAASLEDHLAQSEQGACKKGRRVSVSDDNNFLFEVAS